VPVIVDSKNTYLGSWPGRLSQHTEEIPLPRRALMWTTPSSPARIVIV
jgi:hypothetical protein